MNKRRFLQLLGSAVATPFVKRLPVWAAGDKRLTNWSGNIAYSTENIRHAATETQVKEQVVSLPRMKALGTRHCFNTIADSRDALLALDGMHEMALDAEAKTVTVGAAVKYGQLGPYLDAKGFAVHNLASLPHISVVGACMTATHGSGERNGNLATSVTALEMVTAEGDLIRLEQESGDFAGAVVGLGALGVVTRVTLKVEPTFQVRQYVYQNLPVRQMQEHFDQIQASGYSVSLFTDWQKDRVSEVWIKSRVGGADKFKGPGELFGAKLAHADVHPIYGISAENCTKQGGVPGPWYDRLPHFRMGFTPSAGAELQTEYLVPRKHALEAIMAVQRLREHISPHLLISEIRTIAADNLWMSTAYGRESVAIHFTWKPEWAAVRTVLPMIERELASYDPRPHWGKLFTVPALELRGRYEKHNAFVAMAQRFDPKGKFRNDFLNQNVFAVT